MRKRKGYALISIIAIGFAAVAFLLAVAEIVTSSMRVTSANRWNELLRNAAEIGIDYAIDQYNSVPGGLDPPNPNATTSTIVLDPSYLQNCGVPNVSVTITSVRMINSDVSDWSQLQTISSTYSPQLDPTRTASLFLSPTSTSLMSSPGGGYRVITSTASNGISSKSIRVVLRARFDPPPDLNNQLGGATPSYQSIFPSTPLFSNGSLQLNSSNLTIQGFNSQTGQSNTAHSAVDSQNNPYAAYDLNVMTNTFAQLGPNNTIIGDLSVLSNSSGNAPIVQIPGLTNGGTIEGRLIGNGTIPTTGSNAVVIAPSGPSGTVPAPGVGSANVLADADGGPNSTSTRQGLNASQPSNSPAGFSQTLLAPTPVSSGTSLAPLAFMASNNESINGANSSNGITGNYSSMGLTTDGMSAGSHVSIANSSGPVTIFVQDSGTNTAINLDTQFINAANAGQTSSARNLQIYYQGTDAVNLKINGNTFTGIIYAPNAPVTISGTGTFNGGIVGGNVSVTLNGSMNLYTDLSTAPASSKSGQQAAQAPGGSLYYQSGANGPVIQGWQPVTWQELKP